MFNLLDKMGDALAGGARDVLAVDLDDLVSLLDAGLLSWGAEVHTSDFRGQLTGEREAEAAFAFWDRNLREGSTVLDIAVGEI